MPRDTFPTMIEAFKELAARRADAKSADVLMRVEKSPYGGFVIRSMPADLYLDLVEAGVRMPTPSGKYSPVTA